MFSLATTISYIHFLYWLQLHPTVGPVVISASQVPRNADIRVCSKSRAEIFYIQLMRCILGCE